MLPNWLYTQKLLPVALAALAADPAADRTVVLARLSASPLAEVGRHEWEQVGRGLAALGAASPAIGYEFAEHLSRGYRDAVPPPYLVRAALLVSVAVGGVSSAVRRTTSGAAATAVLTAQAALLRVLSMLDVFTFTGRELEPTVCASFHAVVRGAARTLLDVPDLGEVVRVMLTDNTLDGPEWDERVARSLVGDWSSFEGCD